MASDSHLNISRRRFRRRIVWVAAALLAMHAFVYVFDRYDVFGETLLRRLGNVSTENTFPTWLAAVLLLTTALMCWVVGHVAKADRFYWNGLGVVLILLSVDEVASFHEAAAGPLRRLLDLDGGLYYAWVIPAVVLVVSAVIVFWRFLFRLPPSLRNQLMLASALYVVGAVGFEILEGVLSTDDQRDSFGFFALVTVEEFLEMAGAALAIDALLGYLAARGGRLAVAFVDS